MTVAQLEQRMNGWLDGEYRAVLYEDNGEVVAYALFREQAEEIYDDQGKLRETHEKYPVDKGHQKV